MKKIFNVITLPLLMIFSAEINAQIITETETFGNAEMTTTMDTRVQNILNESADGCKKTASTKKSTTKTTATSTNSTHTKKMTQAEICRDNPRILGYKIQVGVVKSNEEANQLRTQFRQAFPNIKVEIDASLRPNYKVLAGSYLSKQSASSDLKRVRSSFKSATSVQYRVFCVEAK